MEGSQMPKKKNDKAVDKAVEKGLTETMTKAVRVYESGRKVGEKKEINIIDVRKFPDGVTPASVKIKYGLNLDDFQSARIDMEWWCPCLPEEQKDAHAYVDAHLSEYMRREVAFIRKNTDAVLGINVFDQDD
jgi:hypothetical protein